MRDSRICYDIYALARDRTRELIDRFADTYVDVPASEDRGGEELKMVPLGYQGRTSDIPNGRWDCTPAVSLSHIVEVGLARPPRAFTVYLEAADPNLCGASLTFTRDGKLILGLSSPYVEHAVLSEGQPEHPEVTEAREFARSALLELIERFGPLPSEQFGVVTIAMPPPLDAREIPDFRAALWPGIRFFPIPSDGNEEAPA